LDIVSPKGAEILVDGIRKGLFVPPLEDAGWRSPEENESLVHAAKIKPEDRHIDWPNWTWLDISRRHRVIGPLWSKVLVASDASAKAHSFQYRRMIITEMEEVQPMKGSGAYAVVPGLPFVDGAHPVEPRQGKGVYVYTKDGKLVRIHTMKVEGEQKADAHRAALKARMIGVRTFSSDGFDYTPFYNPLL
jgi:methionyl-tRNA formyltransferase